MSSRKTTKLQIRASEEMCSSYRCGIEKTSSQMRTPDHQGGSNRLFSQKYRQWLQRKSTCCSTSLVRYILFSLDWWSAYRDVVVSVKHLCIKQNKVFLIYIVFNICLNAYFDWIQLTLYSSSTFSEKFEGSFILMFTRCCWQALTTVAASIINNSLQAFWNSQLNTKWRMASNKNEGVQLLSSKGKIRQEF